MPAAIKTHRAPALPAQYRTLKERQGTRTLALNGAAWRRLRALVLTEQPLCAHCLDEGSFSPATDVDHVDNDPANNARSNLVGLCHRCHSRKTRQWQSDKNRQQPTAANRIASLTHAAAVQTPAGTP